MLELRLLGAGSIRYSDCPLPGFRVTDAGRADYATYTEVSVDLGAYADGDTHLLRFSSSVFGGGITNISLDDVRLETMAEVVYLPIVVRWG